MRGALELPELLHLEALRQSLCNPVRVHNVEVHIKHLQMKKGIIMGKPRLTREGKGALAEVDKALRKSESAESHLRRAVEHCEHLARDGQAAVGGKMSCLTAYTGKYNRICRLSPEAGRYAGMSRLLQNLANPDVDSVVLGLYLERYFHWGVLPPRNTI
jgi:hypothetical protein